MCKLDFESSYPMKAGFNTLYGSTAESYRWMNEHGIEDLPESYCSEDETPVVIDFEQLPYLCGFFKQWLTLPPDDVDSDYTATSAAIAAACEKALFYGNNTDGVRLINDDAAGFIYTDRNSGVQYVDIFTPDGEFDMPYNAKTIAAVMMNYMPDLVRYAMVLKKKGRTYNIIIRFFMELLNVPTELIEDALDYLGGEQ